MSSSNLLGNLKWSICVVGLLSGFWSTNPGIAAEGTDQPASVRSATDAYLPYQIVLDGFVVLRVSLSAKGEVTDIQVLRNPGSMVSAAESSVKTWRFKPAVEAGQSVGSEMTVVFVYRPGDYGGSKATLSKPFTAMQPQENSDGFSPAGILSVSYPEYPVNSVAWGSVIVEANLDKSGLVKETETVRAQEPFTHSALEALKKWRFSPATRRGKPVDSSVAIAFVFQQSQ